jgi:hypothetical protein
MPFWCPSLQAGGLPQSAAEGPPSTNQSTESRYGSAANSQRSPVKEVSERTGRYLSSQKSRLNKASERISGWVPFT